MKVKKIFLGLSSALLILSSLALISQLSNNNTEFPKPDFDSSINSNTSSNSSTGNINSDITSSDDIPNDNDNISKKGWNLVNDISEINENDYVCFVSSLEEGITMGEFNSEVKRFNPLKFSLNDGTMSINAEKNSYYKINSYEGGYTFVDYFGRYITSAYSSSNTCKLTNELNEYSTFDIRFEDDYLVAKARGDKKCNTIKYTTSYFSLYAFESGNFPYMLKWYGESVPEFEYVPNLDEYTSWVDLNEWEVVSSDELVLEAGMDIIPVLDNDDILLPVNFQDQLAHAEIIDPYSSYYCSYSEIVSFKVIESEYNGYFKLLDNVSSNEFLVSDETALVKIDNGNLTLFYPNGDELINRGNLVYGSSEYGIILSYEDYDLFNKDYISNVSFYLVRK